MDYINYMYGIMYHNIVYDNIKQMNELEKLKESDIDNISDFDNDDDYFIDMCNDNVIFNDIDVTNGDIYYNMCEHFKYNIKILLTIYYNYLDKLKSFDLIQLNNAKNYNGDNAYLLAVQCGHLEIIKYLETNEIDINIKNNNGDNAYLLAVINGNLEIMKHLEKIGLDIHIKNNDGDDAHVLSTRLGHLNIIKHLEEIELKEQKLLEEKLFNEIKYEEEKILNELDDMAIITILKQTKLKSLNQLNILKELKKVNIINYNKMINYLYNHTIDFEILKQQYAIKIISHFNKSKFKLMLKNHIFKYFLTSNDDYFNWLSCSIEISMDDMVEKIFDPKQYKIDVDKFNEFTEFYDRTDHPIIKSK
jgi:hypothetical protein